MPKVNFPLKLWPDETAIIRHRARQLGEWDNIYAGRMLMRAVRRDIRTHIDGNTENEAR